MRKAAVSLLLVIALGSCVRHEKFRYNTGSFPTTPVNLGSINSAEDDYNSALPTIGDIYPLVFSSKRNSSGGNFDFIFKWLEVSMSRVDGVLTISEPTINYNADLYAANDNIRQALETVNTDRDELGPYLVRLGSVAGSGPAGLPVNLNQFALLYATNVGGNLDIRYTENRTTGSYSAPKDLAFLNSPKDDAYPCFTKDTGAVYFCSNRDGNFDIYRSDFASTGARPLTVLKDSVAKHSITKDTDLSSGGDDKCPFIMGNLMIFTSNRAGGFGGYDLYYSRFSNGKWSAPVNFGDKINTAADEYRPIVLNTMGFTNDFMIFSSNRSGGKGGFDLYYVGIEKMSD